MYFTGLALAGFTTVIILELTIGGVLMISLGIIGTYIAQIYQEVKYRPRYVVADRLGSDSGGAERGTEEVRATL
jgi:dolichol-phosphate mannosyltransferase